MPVDNAMRNVERMTLQATVVRADGSLEPLGIVAGYDMDPTEQAKFDALGLGGIRFKRETS
jgi:hypothetical protein